MHLDEILEKLKSGKKRGTRNRQFLGDDVLYYFVPPRLSEECDNRAKQLKCYGNAVVPYQVLPVFEAIKAVEG